MKNTIGSDVEAVQRLFNKMFDSYLANDLDAMLTCYTDDVVVMPQVGDSIFGLDDWREFVGARMPNEDIELGVDYQIGGIEVVGDIAWEWHVEWKWWRDRKTGESGFNYIKAFHLLTRQSDGEWKISKYIWNRIRENGDHTKHMREALAKMPTD